MTLTRERPTHDEVRPAPDPIRWEIPEPLPQPPRQPLTDRMVDYLQTPIPGLRAVGLALAWMALFWLGASVEPPPADPEVGGVFSEVLFPLAFVGAMGAMFAGLAHCRRWGVVGAVIASGMLVAASVLCPVSGHHSFGTWWLVQLGAVATALGLSWRALRVR